MKSNRDAKASNRRHVPHGKPLARRVTFTVKLSMAMCIVYVVWLGTLSSLHNYGYHNLHSFRKSFGFQQSALQEFRKTKRPIAEVHVVSLLESKFEVFRHRNFDLANGGNEVDDDDDDGYNNDIPTEQRRPKVSVRWFEALDGMDERVLDEWHQRTQLYRLNATEFAGPDAAGRKHEYASPHAVGCYLSHWKLLERAWNSWVGNKKYQRRNSKDRYSNDGEATGGTETLSDGKRRRFRLRPDMLFVFEDDAHCVSNLIERTWGVVQQLPKDWDILYIGGKPFSYHTMGKSLSDYVAANEAPNNATNGIAEKRPSDRELFQRKCNGEFGTSLSGPFPSEGAQWRNAGKFTTNDSLPPYYQTKTTLNTNAYVVNPKRIRRVLRVLSQPMYEYLPIDVVLAKDMFREFYDPVGTNSSSNSAPLKAFLTPSMYCDQNSKRLIVDRDKPPPWEGYYWLPWRKKMKGFPDASAFVWGTIAGLPNMCSSLASKQ